MATQSTYTGNQQVGELVASGLENSGVATLNLDAGFYIIQALPSSINLRASANYPSTLISGQWITTPSSIFLKVNEPELILSGTPTFGGFANTLRAVPLWDGTNWQAVSRINVGTGGTKIGVIYYSTDFVTWDVKDTGSDLDAANTNNGIYSFVYNGSLTNKYVLTRATNSTTTALWTSTDSVTWTSRSLPAAPETTGPTGITLNPNATNKYVVNLGTSASNQLCYSTDGVTWTQATFTYANALYYGATNNTASTNEIYVYGGANTTNNIVTSTDAVTWTSRSTGVATAAHHVIYFNSKYYVFHNNSASYAYSTNGVTWTTATLPGGLLKSSENQVIPTIHNNNLYVPTSASGLFLYTTNGTTWSNVRYTQNNINLVSDGTNLFLTGVSIALNCPVQPLYYRIFRSNPTSSQNL